MTGSKSKKAKPPYKTKMIPVIHDDDHFEMGGGDGKSLVVQFISKFSSATKAMDGFVMSSEKWGRYLLVGLAGFLQMRGSKKAVVINHVKWRRCTGDPEFYPSADTERFKELVGTNRGLLIFIPAEEDYGPKREKDPP